MTFKQCFLSMTHNAIFQSTCSITNAIFMIFIADFILTDSYWRSLTRLQKVEYRYIMLIAISHRHIYETCLLFLVTVMSEVKATKELCSKYSLSKKPSYCTIQYCYITYQVMYPFYTSPICRRFGTFTPDLENYKSA